MAVRVSVAAAAVATDLPGPELERKPGYWLARFQAMASPCEMLMDGVSAREAKRLANHAAREAWRIEKKFSRYLKGNVVDRINSGEGRPIRVDAETARLLDYANECFQLSEGRFDITSGILRKAWRFDGSDRLPDPLRVAELLDRIGWHRVQWKAPELVLPAGMEIDLGGVGKEYAVDRTLLLLQESMARPSGCYSILVNFGGDLACSGPRPDGQGWRVGIEDSFALAQTANAVVLRKGALATSGDSRRYLIRDGIRYGHILDPLTGWPVPEAPHSVSVAAPSCTLAGMLATFAMLSGSEAEDFLGRQGTQFWVQRGEGDVTAP